MGVNILCVMCCVSPPPFGLHNEQWKYYNYADLKPAVSCVVCRPPYGLHNEQWEYYNIT